MKGRQKYASTTQLSKRNKRSAGTTMSKRNNTRRFPYNTFEQSLPGQSRLIGVYLVLSVVYSTTLNTVGTSSRGQMSEKTEIHMIYFSLQYHKSEFRPLLQSTVHKYRLKAPRVTPLVLYTRFSPVPARNKWGLKYKLLGTKMEVKLAK